jgi:membrane protein DedA with SNARE-associated domain
MLATIIQWIIHYKYGAIFLLLMLGIVGLPIPDETLLTFAGYLIHRGHVQALPTVISALLGSICGITISYLLGRAGALLIIKKHIHYFHITPEKLARAEDWFNRKGKWSLVIGYYLPGIRHIIAIIAGASKFRYHEFALYAYTGASLWVSVFISAGYLLGEGWYRVSHEVHHVLAIISIIAVGVVLLYFLIRKQPEAFRYFSRKK